VAGGGWRDMERGGSGVVGWEWGLWGLCLCLVVTEFVYKKIIEPRTSYNIKFASRSLYYLLFVSIILINV
jgi:hypothetical protein